MTCAAIHNGFRLLAIDFVKEEFPIMDKKKKPINGLPTPDIFVDSKSGILEFSSGV